MPARPVAAVCLKDAEKIWLLVSVLRRSGGQHQLAATAAPVASTAAAGMRRVHLEGGAAAAAEMSTNAAATHQAMAQAYTPANTAATAEAQAVVAMVFRLFQNCSSNCCIKVQKEIFMRVIDAQNDRLLYATASTK